MKKSAKISFTLSMIMTIITFGFFIPCMLLGIEGLTIKANNTGNGEGLALIAIIPIFLIYALVLLGCAIIGIIPSIKCLVNKYKIVFSIIFIVVNALTIITNLIIFLKFL